MATPLDLSIKRAVEEVDSGEGSEASKKAKLGSGDYSQLRSIKEFYDLYGHLFRKPNTVWEQYLSDLKDQCRFREIQLFLVSHLIPPPPSFHFVCFFIHCICQSLDG
jgi:hypothetical protein